MAANEQQRKEPRELREPAHHARRPMNAFLIFCKRHRGSVRSGFPHLENRAVTRVLGEWWATLHPDQKRSYTNLAQEYKDAFLNANPDFKWYKLPAPPLRTLNTRPTNKKTESSSNEHPIEIKSENESSDYSKADKRDGQSIQPGKLADESQIGGLSSLFTPQKMQIIDEQATINGSVIDDDNEVPKPPKKKYIDASFSSDLKRECKADLFDVKKKRKSESNNNEQQYDIEDEKIEINNFITTNMPSEETNFRSERTCKGLRYQKFLAEQMKNIGVSGQQPKRKRHTGNRSTDGHSNERRNSISSNVSEKTDSLSSEGGNSSRGELEHLVESAEGNIEASKPEETETEGAEGELDFGPWSTRKRFRAEDFNLEKKIEALPSLSLEEFQEKKKQQRTKKKKIVQKLTSTSNNKKNQNNCNANGQANVSNNQTDRESTEESDKALLVGSQKRKARKQSITRNAAATSDSTQNEADESNKPWCASPDLEALACLATVAAYRTKLTKINT
ncbi:bobby sox isoform X1 [Lasioglossum baleicum]|uniref:bobby sox isoform X1 n=2 Tax=Lasioglossum baleicum TaxID=434251 RepID=UPI003FCC6838